MKADAIIWFSYHENNKFKCGYYSLTDYPFYEVDEITVMAFLIKAFQGKIPCTNITYVLTVNNGDLNFLLNDPINGRPSNSVINVIDGEKLSRDVRNGKCPGLVEFSNNLFKAN